MTDHHVDEPVDDELDGCDIDFAEYAVGDEDALYVALFAGADTPEAVAELEVQYRQLAGMPAPDEQP